jgi:hypothetical protein
LAYRSGLNHCCAIGRQLPTRFASSRPSETVGRIRSTTPVSDPLLMKCSSMGTISRARSTGASRPHGPDVGAGEWVAAKRHTLSDVQFCRLFARDRGFARERRKAIPRHSLPCGGCASLNQDRRCHSQVSIPRQEPEFGTIAESVILCSGHRPSSMILTKQIMRTNSNEQGRR